MEKQIDCTRNSTIKEFKDVGFSIDIEINLKVVESLDITFNLNNDTHKSYERQTIHCYIYKEEYQPPTINNRPIT